MRMLPDRCKCLTQSIYAYAAMKAAVLLGSTLICATIAASGFSLLSFLLLTRTLAPATATYRTELFFDFTKADAVASAAFCPTPAVGKVEHSQQLLLMKTLWPGQPARHPWHFQAGYRAFLLTQLPSCRVSDICACQVYVHRHRSHSCPQRQLTLMTVSCLETKG